jgi:hypothetical protein
MEIPVHNREINLESFCLSAMVKWAEDQASFALTVPMNLFMLTHLLAIGYIGLSSATFRSV